MEENTDALMRVFTHHHHDIRSDAWSGIGASYFFTDTDQG